MYVHTYIRPVNKRGVDEGKSPPRGVDGWPPGPFKGLGPGPLRAPLGPLRAWARALVGPPGPLWATLGPCGPLWAGPLWAGPLWAWPLWAPLGPHGPGP